MMRFDDEPVRPGMGTTCRPSSAPERDTLIWDPIRGLHQGQRPCAAQTGRTHGSTRPVVVYVGLPLRQRGRPHMTDTIMPWVSFYEGGLHHVACAACRAGVFGPPGDREAALAVLREAFVSGVDHIDTSDFYNPHVTNRLTARLWWLWRPTPRTSPWGPSSAAGGMIRKPGCHRLRRDPQPRWRERSGPPRSNPRQDRSYCHTRRRPRVHELPRQLRLSTVRVILL